MVGNLAVIDRTVIVTIIVTDIVIEIVIAACPRRPSTTFMLWRNTIGTLCCVDDLRCCAVDLCDLCKWAVDLMWIMLGYASRYCRLELNLWYGSRLGMNCGGDCRLKMIWLVEIWFLLDSWMRGESLEEEYALSLWVVVLAGTSWLDLDCLYWMVDELWTWASSLLDPAQI